MPSLIAVSQVKVYPKRSKKEPHRAADRPAGLFSLRSAELIQRLLMQEANLSQVPLRFCNVVPYDTELFPDCNLAGMMQRGFKALDAKRGTSGQRHFAFVRRRWLTWLYPQVCRNLASSPLQIATASADC